MKRKNISKSVRFKIFARDNFTCRYCGRQSDAVILEVDHIIPVSQDGTNDDENLITSCFDCNRGKGGKTITQAAPTELDRLRIAQESGEQMKAALAAREAAKARTDLRQEVCNYFCRARGSDKMDNQTLNILTSYVTFFGADPVFNWIDTAVKNLSPYKNDDAFGRYISGCRRKYLEDQS